MTPTPQATVVITTKNRKDILRGAIESSLRQTAPLELLVVDDASTDGTSEMVGQEFPAARLHRAERSEGYIVQRNLGASLASAPIVFSIDDDAAFPSSRTVEQTLAEFGHPRVGAVAIPFIDVNKGPQVRQRAPGPDRIYVAQSFIGTAHALRKDLFLRLGGYRPFLVHQGEEHDYCVRMLQAGYVTRLGAADPIHHFESPQRDVSRMDLFGRRNDVLYAWHNVPMPYLPVHLLATSLDGVLWGLRCGRPARMLRGLARGYGALPSQWNARTPLSRPVYRLSRDLRKRGPLTLEEIEARLPAMT